MPDTDQSPVRSPCISICKLDSDGVCVGCFRDRSEISYWTTYSDIEKQAVLDSCNQREKARRG